MRNDQVVLAIEGLGTETKHKVGGEYEDIPGVYYYAFGIDS